jgi:hypothetical protein
MRRIFSDATVRRIISDATVRRIQKKTAFEIKQLCDV